MTVYSREISYDVQFVKFYSRDVFDEMKFVDLNSLKKRVTSADTKVYSHKISHFGRFAKVNSKNFVL